MAYCRNCGSKYEEEDYFCSNCGMNIQKKPTIGKSSSFFYSRPSQDNISEKSQTQTREVEFVASSSSLRRYGEHRTHYSKGVSIIALGFAFIFIALILASVFFLPLLALDSSNNYNNGFDDIGGVFNELGYKLSMIGSKIGRLCGNLGVNLGETFSSFVQGHHGLISFGRIFFISFIIFFLVLGIILIVRRSRHSYREIQ